MNDKDPLGLFVEQPDSDPLGLFSSEQKPAKRDTTLMEDVSIGLSNAATPVLKFGGLVAGGLAGAVGNDYAQDSIYKGMEDAIKTTEDYWVPKDAKQSFGGKVAGTLATLPQQLLAFPFSPADTGYEMVKAGETSSKAQDAASIDALMNVVGIAAPGAIGGSLLKKFVSGAGINAAQEAYTKKVISTIAETDEAKKKFEPTWEGAALAGIVGGPLGMVTPSHKAQTPQTTPPKVEPAADVVPKWDGQDDLSRAIQSRKSLEQSIITTIEATDPNNTKALDKLAQDLTTVQEELKLLGDNTSVPEPKVEGADVDTTTAFNPYGYLNQEGNRGIDVLSDVDSSVPREQPDADLDALIAAFDDGTAGWRENSEQGLSDRYSVNEAINAKTAEYSKYSIDVLTKMIKNKDYKLNNIKDPELHNLIAQERELLVKELIKKQQGDMNAHTDKQVISESVDLAKLTSELDAVVRNSADPIRSGLDFIAGKRNDPTLEPHGKYLSELADQLRNNPNIGKDGFKFNSSMKEDGSYSNLLGDIEMNPHNFHVGTFLHEVVHSAVNKILTLAGEGKVTDFRTKQAVANIEKLFTNVKENFGFILDKYVSKEQQAFMLENPREFVAYGLTNSNMIAALKRMRLGGESGFSKFKSTVMNLLGLSDKARTAFSELLENGGHIITASDGTALGRNIPKSFAQANTPTKLLDGVKTGALNIFAHGFTAQLRQLMKDNKHFMAVSNAIDVANRTKESLDQALLYGKTTYTDWKNKGFLNTFALSATEKADALVPSMYNLKGAEIHAVYAKFVEGMVNKVDPAQTLQTHSAGWSESQRNFAQALIKISDKLLNASRGMQAGNSLKQMNKLMGYVLTSRTGDHAVTVSYNGVPVRLERYLTKAEAEFRQAEFQKNNTMFEVRYDHTKNFKDQQSTIDFLQDSLDNIPPGRLAAELQVKLDTMLSKNSSIGNHMMTSRLVAGFAGDQAGLTAHQKGELLRSALPRAVKAYTQNIASRDIHKQHIDYMANNNVDKTTADLTDFYVRTQTDGLIPEGSKRETLQTLSAQVRESVDYMADKVFGFHARDKHALDRFTGLFSNVFYTANITMKPTIWLAQPLQALMSARSAFKTQESPRTVLLAMGAAMKDIVGGKLTASDDFAKALFHISQDGNTLHPQMTNEFNDWKVGTDPNTILNATVNMITGRTISAAGDKFSRYASFAFFYHLHKRNGLTGTALYNKAAEDTTANMIGYGSKNMPAIYREMGIFGEQSAPLATFGHGQAGNLIVDIKEFMSSPSARTSAPLILTAGVIMMLGGAISLPLIAEYELIRLAGIKAGWWGSEWPDATEMLLVHAPKWVSHGVLSASTGVDVDASMRYTSLMQKVTNVQNQGVLSLFPPLSWGASAISGVGTLASEASGNKHTPAELDTAIKDVVPKGIIGGVVDQARNNWDLLNPEDQKNPLTRMGKAGRGGVERTSLEKKAPFFGARSLNESMVSLKTFNETTLEARRTKDLSRATQLFSDGNHEEAIKIMMKYEQNPNAAVNAIKAQIIAEKTPAAIRGKVGKTGTMSYEQARKWNKHETTPFLEKLHDRN